MTCERDVESYFKAQVEKAGGQHRKVRWLNKRGAPDQFVFGLGCRWLPVDGRQRALFRSAFAEIKKPGEPLRSHQAREIKLLREAGLRVYLIDSFEGVDDFIAEMTK